jgi:hypothetical protein
VSIEEARKVTLHNNRRNNKLDVYLSRMESGDYNEAMTILHTRDEADPRLYRYSAEWVAAVLTRAGFVVGESTVKKYRRMTKQLEGE